MESKEFTKGDTDNSGDDGKYEAGIHHLTIDATEWEIGGEIFRASKDPQTWFQRIVVYGNSEAQAEALRDRVLVALNSSPVGAGDDRETIRAVFLRNGFTIKEGQTDLKPYVYAAADELMSIARASLSAPNHSEQVREGWQLVPVEMTDEMYFAFCDARNVTGSNYRHAYAAAIAAAPSAGSQGGDV